MCKTNFIFLALVLLSANATATKQHDRIFGGVQARPKIYRRLAGMWFPAKEPGGMGYMGCTATVLRRRWVITAAHCLKNDNVDAGEFWQVVVGSRFSIAPTGQRKHNVSATYILKNYPMDSSADLGLIELQEGIHDDEYYRVSMGGAPDEGTEVIIAGYGLLRDDGEDDFEDSIYAMEASVQAFDWETCVKNEPAANTWFKKEKHVCFAAKQFPEQGSDTCGGDSGGPVFKIVDGTPVLYAVHSGGPVPCGLAGGQGWNMRASYYKKAIQELIETGAHPWFRRL